MSSCEELLAVELEALQCTFGDNIEPPIVQDGTTVLKLRLFPRATEYEWERYVMASLLFRVPPAYPDVLPSFQLTDDKGKIDCPAELTDFMQWLNRIPTTAGLSEHQIASCLASLQGEAQILQGELLLGHLCDLTTDFLTASNHPAGDCVFCLQPNILQPATGSPAYRVVKLACYHSFHRYTNRA